MKRNKLPMVFIFGIVFMPITALNAAITNCIGTVCPSDDWTSINSQPTNCASYSDYCYGSETSSSKKVYSCNICSSGYKIQSGSVSVSGCSNTITANTCVQDCTGCTDCSTTSWTASSIGYQERTYATCNCNTCTKTTQYRCAAGYYGNPTTGTSGCTLCPSSGIYSNSGLTTLISATSAAGSTTKTSCYIPSGTTFYDATGSGEYDGNSYYCE